LWVSFVSSNSISCFAFSSFAFSSVSFSLVSSTFFLPSAGVMLENLSRLCPSHS